MSENFPIHSISGDIQSEIAIVASRFNSEHVDALLKSTIETLVKNGISRSNIVVTRVPGANEIPFAVNMHAETGVLDVVIALGVVLAGATNHHEVIAYSTSQALQEIAISSRTPVINGIITVENEKQAYERCHGKANRGKEFALAAIEMAEVSDTLWQDLMSGMEDDDFTDILQQMHEDGNWDDDDDDDLDGEEWKS